MKKATVLVSLILMSAPFAKSISGGDSALSIQRLGNVLECLQQKAPALGYGSPKYDTHASRVRYVYGKFSAVDKEDELHLLVYGPHEESAILFELYLGTREGKPEILVGDLATLERENGSLEVEEIPGGLATPDRIERLLRVVERRPALTIRDSEVKAGPDACVSWKDYPPDKNIKPR